MPQVVEWPTTDGSSAGHTVFHQGGQGWHSGPRSTCPFCNPPAVQSQFRYCPHCGHALP